MIEFVVNDQGFPGTKGDVGSRGVRGDKVGLISYCCSLFMKLII